MSLTRFFRRRYWDEERAREVEAYLEIETDENIARGMSPEEARYAAHRKLGNVTLIREEIYHMNSLGSIETLWQDLRFALRMLRKNPGFTAVAVLTLALGIGANTAIFSLINALILRSLPVRDPQQLVAISTISPDAQNGKDPLSLPMFEEIQKHQGVFSKMFAWNGGGMINFEANGFKYAASTDTVSGDYFSTLGVQPFLGRLIGPADVGLETGASAPVAVVSYACWQRRYNSDPAIIGKTIRVNDRPLTIIGVTPRKFTGLFIAAAPDAFVPIGFTGSTGFRKPENLSLNVVARLEPGTTLEQARAQLTSLWPGIQTDTLPPLYQGEQRARFFARRIEVESIATGISFLRERFGHQLTVLMGLVGLVLLISCVNLANLTLARATAREHEVGIRVALGASGWRLVRQLITESILLSAAGALLGLAFASWTTRLLAHMCPWGGGVVCGPSQKPVVLNVSPKGTILVSPAASTPGMFFTSSRSWRKAIRVFSGFEVTCGEITTCRVRRSCALNPGSVAQSRWIVRTISPAPTNKTKVWAVSAITKMFCVR